MSSGSTSTKRQSPFEVYADSELRMLIEKYPLAWVCSAGIEEGSLLPLVGVFDSEHRLTELIGHYACKNPLGEALVHNTKATILFTGPSGYISPLQAERSNWAPTWNYAQARIEAEISVEPKFTAAAVDILIDKMEQGVESPWSITALGERYELLLPHIVGFRARVIKVHAKFKLGQDERIDTLRAILNNIDDEDLKWWMHYFNRERLATR